MFLLKFCKKVNITDWKSINTHLRFCFVEFYFSMLLMYYGCSVFIFSACAFSFTFLYQNLFFYFLFWMQPVFYFTCSWTSSFLNRVQQREGFSYLRRGGSEIILQCHVINFLDFSLFHDVQSFFGTNNLVGLRKSFVIITWGLFYDWMSL